MNKNIVLIIISLYVCPSFSMQDHPVMENRCSPEITGLCDYTPELEPLFPEIQNLSPSMPTEEDSDLHALPQELRKYTIAEDSNNTFSCPFPACTKSRQLEKIFRHFSLCIFRPKDFDWFIEVSFLHKGHTLQVYWRKMLHDYARFYCPQCCRYKGKRSLKELLHHILAKHKNLTPAPLFQKVDTAIDVLPPTPYPLQLTYSSIGIDTKYQHQINMYNLLPDSQPQPKTNSGNKFFWHSQNENFTPYR